MLELYVWLQTRIEMLRAHSETGAAAVEYGLLVGLIAAVIIAAVTAIGLKVNAGFCDVVAALPGSPVTC